MSFLRPNRSIQKSAITVKTRFVNPIIAGKNIAVCSLAGIEVVLICHGRPVPDDMKAAAEREEVGIVVTDLSQFAAAVALSSLSPAAK